MIYTSFRVDVLQRSWHWIHGRTVTLPTCERGNAKHHDACAFRLMMCLMKQRLCCVPWEYRDLAIHIFPMCDKSTSIELWLKDTPEWWVLSLLHEQVLFCKTFKAKRRILCCFYKSILFGNTRTFLFYMPLMFCNSLFLLRLPDRSSRICKPNWRHFNNNIKTLLSCSTENCDFEKTATQNMPYFRNVRWPIRLTRKGLHIEL